MAARKYPWERWFDGGRTEIRRGADYHLSQSMMYATIKNNASLRALRVRVTETDDGRGFIIDCTEGVRRSRGGQAREGAGCG